LSTRQWDSTGCTVACVMAEGHAQCVDSPAPIAECAGGDGPTCYQGSTTYCVGGYPTSTQACDQGLHCVPSATCGTVCASADAPDARCGTAPSSFFCDGDATLTACTCGFPGPSYACAPGVCHEMAGDSFCVASTTPDPRCGDPAKPMGGFCDGQIARECWYGLLTASTDCGTTATCVILGDGSAACQFTPMHG
jgi:hypothetical protein